MKRVSHPTNTKTEIKLTPGYSHRNSLGAASGTDLMVHPCCSKYLT